MNGDISVYDFTFRARLTEEALDRAGRPPRNLLLESDQDMASAVALDLLDPDLVKSARSMAIVYTAMAAFENSAREFVVRVLRDAFGDEWWEKGFAPKTRTSAEKRRGDERDTSWHADRGEDLVTYTMLGDLKAVVKRNWDLFEDYVRNEAWVTATFDQVERSRNVIMHSGVLELEDCARVGMVIRNWVKQVGT